MATLVAGDPVEPDGDAGVRSARWGPDICLDGLGQILVQEHVEHPGAPGVWTLRRVAPDGSSALWAGSPTVSGSRDGPLSMALLGNMGRMVQDGSGGLWFTDTTGSLGTTALRRIRDGVAGTVRTLSTGRTGFASCVPAAFAVDGDGSVLVAWNWRSASPSLEGAVLQRIDPRGRSRLLAGSYTRGGQEDGRGESARFQCITALAAGPGGDLTVADTSGGTTLIRRVGRSGKVTTLAGGPGAGHQDGPGPAARFSEIRALACGPDGTLFAADGRTVRRISPWGTVSTLAGGSGPEGPLPPILGLSLAPSGELVLVSSRGILRLSGF